MARNTRCKAEIKLVKVEAILRKDETDRFKSNVEKSGGNVQGPVTASESYYKSIGIFTEVEHFIEFLDIYKNRTRLNFEMIIEVTVPSKKGINLQSDLKEIMAVLCSDEAKAEMQRCVSLAKEKESGAKHIEKYDVQRGKGKQREYAKAMKLSFDKDTDIQSFCRQI